MFNFSNIFCVLAADRKLYRWFDCHKPIEPRVILESVAIARISTSNPIWAALTFDSRVIAGNLWIDRQMDITDLVCNSLKDGAESIDDVHVYDHTVVVSADDKICIVKFVHDICAFNLRDVGLHTFEHKINYMSFNYHHGLIRTDDNRLYALGNLRVYSGSDRKMDLVDKGPELVEFNGAENIREITCGYTFTLAEMDNGDVYSRGLVEGNDKLSLHSAPFVKVEFPEGVLVTKVTWGGDAIISSEGLCYYVLYAKPCIGLIKGLVNKKVENVFSILGGSVIQCDSGKLYTVGCSPLSSRHLFPGNVVRNFCDIKEEDLTPLPFPEGETVFAVNDGGSRAYFVTDQGRMYFRYFAHSSDFEQIPIFVDNPIVINDGVCRVRSAGSRLDD